MLTATGGTRRGCLFNRSELNMKIINTSYNRQNKNQGFFTRKPQEDNDSSCGNFLMKGGEKNDKF
jgi:hypothetical protein